MITPNIWIIIVSLQAKTRKILKGKSCISNNPHNPPNDYPEKVKLLSLINSLNLCLNLWCYLTPLV